MEDVKSEVMWFFGKEIYGTRRRNSREESGFASAFVASLLLNPRGLATCETLTFRLTHRPYRHLLGLQISPSSPPTHLSPLSTGRDGVVRGFHSIFFLEAPDPIQTVQSFCLFSSSLWWNFDFGIFHFILDDESLFGGARKFWFWIFRLLSLIGWILIWFPFQYLRIDGWSCTIFSFGACKFWWFGNEVWPNIHGVSAWRTRGFFEQMLACRV